MKFNEHDAQILRNIIIHRRDVRGNQFLSTPIDDNLLNQLLYAFEHAPSVGYSQPWQIIIISKQVIKQKVKDIFNSENKIASQKFDVERSAHYQQLKLEGITEAPLNIAIFYKSSDTPVLGQTSCKEVGVYSVVCGIQNMWLMARSLNIGMGWVSILDEEKVKQVLSVPSELQLVAYLCIGYVKEFKDVPDLETLGWETRKNRAQYIHNDFYNTTENE